MPPKSKRPLQGDLPFRRPLEPKPFPPPVEPQRIIHYPDETQRLLREILARLDAVERRLSSIEKILATKPAG